jgi:NhaP-type Na+/H+ or K+/H+ antiporter
MVPDITINKKMHQQLLLVLVLLFIVLLLIMLAQRNKVAYPIFLVLAGLAIGFIPAIPKIRIIHELIFLIFLPPLIYEAAWYTSWNDFWRRKGTIAFLAFDLVFFTSMVVAFTAFSIIPGSRSP